MLHILTGAVALSIIIGYLGRHRPMGFWGMTFGSIVLTPLVGFLILVMTEDVKPPQPPQQPPQQ